jgi:hypothetical protein
MRSQKGLNCGSSLQPFVFDFRNARLAAPATELREMLQGLTDQKYVGVQKRASKRSRIATEVPAVALDEHLCPVGDPFVAMSRDISTGGICLVHTGRVEAPYLLVKLEITKWRSIQLVAKILRCRQLKGFFELAGEFVMRPVDRPTESALETILRANVVDEAALRHWPTL